MPTSWVQPIYIYSLIYDFASYLILSSIFILIYKKKIISIKYLYINFIFLLTPFLFNGFLFDWSLFPDQSKYLDLSYKIRENPERILDFLNYSLKDFKLFLSSLFYAFSPILSMETYVGVSLYNRFLFLITLLFLFHKKFFDNYILILLLICPSLILYSSLALRDNLIIILVLLFLYFFYQKKYFFLTITIILLTLMRYPILINIFIFFAVSSIVKYDRINFKSLIVIFLTSIMVLFIFNDQILDTLNFFRAGFFSEEYGRYKSVTQQSDFENVKIDFSLRSIPIAIIGFFNFLIPPFIKGKITFFYFVQLIETLFILLFSYIKIKFQNKINLFILLKWSVIYFLSYFIYSLIIFNDGTIHRYKLPILFFVIIGYFANIKKEKM